MPSALATSLSLSTSSLLSIYLVLPSLDLLSGSFDLDSSFLGLSRESFLSRDLDLEESELEDELPLELEPLELLREDPLELLELDPALPLRLLRGDAVPLLPDLLPRSRPRSSSLLSPLLPDLDLDLFRSFPLLSTLRSLPRRFAPLRSGLPSLLKLRFVAIWMASANLNFSSFTS